MHMRTSSITILFILLSVLSCSIVHAEDAYMLPSGVIIIESEAFYGTADASIITLPEGVRELHSLSFAYSGFDSINLPSTLTFIADNAFEGSGGQQCANAGTYAATWCVENSTNYCISGTDENYQYSIVNGYATIHAYIGADNRVVIPDCIDNFPVTSISDSAFANKSHVTVIIVGESVTAIGDNAFNTGNASTILLVKEDSFAHTWCEANSVEYYFDVPAVGFTYSISNDVVTINAYTGSNGDVVIPAYIEGYPVTKIKDDAFSGNDTIITMKLPETIVYIGASAFGDCTSLTSINIPAGVTNIIAGTFAGCESLQSISLPESIIAIGDCAFFWCKSLTHIDIPANVRYMGGQMFGSCTKLVSVSYPEGITAVNWGDFEGCTSLTTVSLPSTITVIDGYAFSGCTSLVNITLPSGTTTIKTGAFKNCGNLESINLPSSITSIDSTAFNGCTNLTATVNEGSYAHTWCVNNGVEFELVPAYMAFDFSVSAASVCINGYSGTDAAIVIPSEILGYPVTAINSSAFVNNTTLRTITIPESIISIGANAFNQTQVLRVTENSYAHSYCRDNAISYVLAIDYDYVEVDGTITITGYTGNSPSVSIPSYIDGKPVTRIDSSAFRDNAFITSVTISTGVKSIGWQAFYNCSELSSVSLPDSIETIETAAFADCRNLTAIDLPQNLTIVSDGLFNYSGITQIIIPSKVTRIESRALCSYPPLTAITLPVSVTYIANDAFDDTSKLTATVIEGSYAHRWCIERGITCIITSAANDFDYSVSGAKVCITGYNGNDEYLLIPETISTLPVTGIAANAFASHDNLRAVTVRSNVVSIGANAFPVADGLVIYVDEDSVAHAYCKSNGLRYVLTIDYEYSINSGEVTITCYTGSAKSVAVPDSIDDVPVTTIGWNAFADQTITSVTIPESVTTIQRSAFGNCTELTFVGLPNSLIRIEGWAFSCCYSLESIYIPATVTYIEADAFYNLTEITLYVEADSYAHIWAVEYNMPFVVVE